VQASRTWQRWAESSLRLNCLLWTDDARLLAGTAEARLAWVSEDRIRFIESYDAIPERGEWDTPWGGPPDTRSLAVATDGTLYANIHVGWIARSVDRGESWACMREGLEKDVHQVAVHPEDPSIVFTATATGFHISRDRGESFVRKPGPMPYLYQRGCAWFPGGKTVLVSTSRGPHGQADALLYRSEDHGDHWERVSGLPEGIGSNIDTYQVLPVSESIGYVVIDRTRVFETEDEGRTWNRVAGDFPEIYTGMMAPSV
jgi:hypothetical protein